MEARVLQLTASTFAIPPIVSFGPASSSRQRGLLAKFHHQLMPSRAAL
jgi:hypothetical protein